MCHAINGGKIPHSEWLSAILQIPPTNYDELLLHLQHKGYTVIKHSTIHSNKKTLDRLSVLCLSNFGNEVARLEKICGKRFKVSALPNLQEIFLTLK